MKIDLGIGIRLEGRWEVEKWSESRGTIEKYEFDNIVLDVGWQNFKARMMNGYNSQGAHCVPRWLYLGTGTSEPQPSNTGLQNVSPTLPGKFHLTSDVAGGNGTDEAGLWTSIRYRWDYGEGEAQGNWTELGLGYDSTYVSPYNRSLFRDVNGDPITISVLSDEYLRVFVTIKLYFPDHVKRGKFKVINQTTQTETEVLWTASKVETGWGNYQGSPLKIGFATHVYVCDPSFCLSGAQSQTQDKPNLKLSYTDFVDVGSAFTRSGVGFGVPWSFNRALNVSVSFSPHIVKPFDYRLSGSGSITWFRHMPALESGAVSSSTFNTMTDTTKAWTVDQWAGKVLHLVENSTNNAPGCGQVRPIISNTATTITIGGEEWNIEPGTADRYEIRDVAP